MGDQGDGDDGDGDGDGGDSGDQGDGGDGSDGSEGDGGDQGDGGASWSWEKEERDRGWAQLPQEQFILSILKMFCFIFLMISLV